MTPATRYGRQAVLPEIGAAGQEKLSRAAVLCIGAGGLGCPALLYLAAAGIGRIGIVDFDTVDETNLQRQVLFTMNQVGMNKARAAAERLQALNPEIVIEPHETELTDKNALTLFKNYDVIIDGTDNFAAKFLINDAALKSAKPFVYASILGFEGQLAVFGAPGGPCYRCLFPAPPHTHIPSCAEAGVIGAIAGILGAAQAMEAIKLVLENDSLSPLAGKLWIIDLRTMETRLLSLARDPHCPACSKNPEDIALIYNSPVCGAISEITPQQARASTSALIIDVREQQEWDAGHIENARLVPLSQLAQGFVPELPKNCEIIIHCQKGKRGLQAAQILKARGYSNVSNLQGGYEAWLKCS